MIAEENPFPGGDEFRWPDAGPSWRGHVRRLYDAAAGRLARVNVPRAISLVDAIGRGANLVALHGPALSEVSTLYEWLPEDRLGRIARDICALHLKNRMAIAIVEGGRTADLAKRVRWSSDVARRDVLADRRGLVVVAWHVGAFFGIRAALYHLGSRVLMLRDLPVAEAASRAAALKRAVDHLRDGGLVVSTLDGPGGTSTGEVTCLGRRIALRRGPFTLARLTAAPLVPVACAWTESAHIEVRVGAPLLHRNIGNVASRELEDEMAACAARWLETYLRAEPQEIWLSTLRYYLAAPRM
jgi:hypothetical protein